MQYLMQILMAVMMGVFMLMMLPRAIVCADRIEEVLGHEVKAPVAEGASIGKGSVRFEDVSYTYPGAEQPVLEGISFEARPGTTTAIIGSTGSGKTTLAGLLPRLYSPTSGSVLIDGHPVTRIPRQELVKAVAMVPQKPWLFSGTVASNLRMGNPDATDGQLWAALRVAQAGFVDDLDMPISQGGTNVSGGQRQRLCIARMFVADPKVYVFDDSFSALDATTEANLNAAMREIVQERTVIVVAQKVSSIRHADQILVMEAGRIVARGTHDELLQTSETYREIAASQAEVDA